MRHADAATFDQLEGLLEDLRRVPGVVGKRPGVFYRRSRAFLHFHDDPTGPYADCRAGPEGKFVRLRVRTATEKRQLLSRVRAASAR